MKKKYHILKTQDFQELINTGSKQVNKSFVVYYLPKKESHSRFGISLSKKMGKAHLRNKVKRQVRMMCHELVDFDNFSFDVILIVRNSYLTLSYETNKNNLENALNKATIK